MSKSQYRIQGWKPNRIYPDILAVQKKDENDYDKVYILESKGEHLEFNADTNYKRAFLDLCNNLAVESDINKLDLGFEDPDFEFQMIDEYGWKNQLNTIFANNNA